MMKYLRNHFTRLFLIISVLIYSTAIAATETQPNQIVNAFHKVLLSTMKNAKKLGVKGRYKKIAPEIEQIFHLPLMAQVSSGSYWRKASDKQIKQLVKAFSHISISTYASQFDGFSGQSFLIKGEKVGPQNTILVKTQIIKPETTPINITYVTQKIKKQWRIIDVLLNNGISELAIRRSEYRRILKTDGLNGLIATLNKKADQLLIE